RCTIGKTSLSETARSCPRHKTVMPTTAIPRRLDVTAPITCRDMTPPLDRPAVLYSGCGRNESPARYDQAMKRTIGCLLAAICILWPAGAEDWPEWRGKGRAGVWNETGIADTFPAKLLFAT